MMQVFSSRKNLSYIVFLLTLVSVFRQPASGNECATAGSTAAVAQDLLDDCGRDDPFAPLVAKTAATPPPREEAESPQEAQDQTEAPLVDLKPPKADLPSLCLHGIVWAQNLPLAIINNTLVGIGDKVEGRTIVGIERHEVVLQINGNKEILKIQTPSFVEVTWGASARRKRNVSK